VIPTASIYSQSIFFGYYVMFMMFTRSKPYQNTLISLLQGLNPPCARFAWYQRGYGVVRTGGGLNVVNAFPNPVRTTPDAGWCEQGANVVVRAFPFEKAAIPFVKAA
jgi:hypothetical protein